MKIHRFNSKQFAIAFSFCLGAIAFYGSSSLAQSTNSVNPIDNRDRDGYQSNEQDSMGNTFGNSFNPFDLIHRANMSRGRTMGEFEQETDSGI
jgi:hypothetical protein